MEKNNTDAFLFEFCLAHPKLFISMVSLRYPFNETLAHKYYSILDWNDLSWNYRPWSHRFIRQYQDKWNWKRLSTNENIKFTDKFIKEFKDCWNWDCLVSNKGVKFDKELITYMSKNIGSTEFVSEDIEWTPDAIREISSHFPFQ